MILNINYWVKPKDQKEVNSRGTANHLPIQDRNDEGETISYGERTDHATRHQSFSQGIHQTLL
jgi:hypothetical protein